MRSLPHRLSILFALSISTVAANAQAAKLAAVLPLNAPALDADLRDSIEESIRAVATDSLTPGGYAIISGDDTAKGLKIAGVNTNKPCEGDCAMNSAKALKAWMFVSGSASKSASGYTVFLKLIDANSTKQLASIELSGATIKELRAQFRDNAANFFPRFGATAAVAPLQLGTGTLQTMVEPKSGLEFVRLPGGTFHYGCEPKDEECFENERPGRPATVVPIWFGKTDITVQAYAKCVAAGACTSADSVNWAGITPDDRKAASATCNQGAADKQLHPINCIDWTQASKFCSWIGGRLPTAEEWEFAAKGGESRRYPWGNDDMTGERGNFCDAACHTSHPDFDWADDDRHDAWGDTSPVGAYPKGVSKHGLVNMAGNVYQWTSSNFSTTDMEARGGSWRNRVRILRTSARYNHAPDYRNTDFGARCAM